MATNYQLTKMLLDDAKFKRDSYYVMAEESNRDNMPREAALYQKTGDDYNAAVTMLLKRLEDDDVGRMVAEASQALAAIQRCITEPGADIIITVRRQDEDADQAVTAQLYDHAPLVEGLCEALQDFIDDYT